jgi:autophagy-related protein 9
LRGRLLCYLIWNVLRLAYELPELKEMRVFCALKLGLSDRDFWTITWPEIMQRLKHVQETGTKLSFTRKLDERDIVARIMRKENYLIGMMNKDIVNTSLEPVMKKNWIDKIGANKF